MTQNAAVTARTRTRRKDRLILGWLIAVVISVSSPHAQPRTLAAVQTTQQQKVTALRHAIVFHRQKTWRYQDRARVARTRSAHMERRTSSLSFLGWINNLWQRRMKAASRLRPPASDLGAWMCIHRYEGSWTDAGDPYWGGLQMDRAFMKTYGSDFEREFHGFANVWPVWAQIQAARRARASRGYSPWPNSARLCGLLR